ncbi:ATP synthase F1 subunit gamma [candidate division KSB1 bacterium]|nr:ATP synthase F1 subunit gamma [candidate division KSB1 bacterium]
MATLREIKRRISSVKSTMQITKAMKMVAAAKLQKSQMKLMSTRPYSQKLSGVLENVVKKSKRHKHPLMKERKVKKVCYVLLTADKGLCGSFNANLIRRAHSELNQSEAQKNHLITIGRKGYEHFRHISYPVTAHYIDIFNNLEFSQARVIAGELMKSYLNGKFDRVYIIYNQFKNAVQQDMIVEQFLPIVPEPTEEKIHPAGYVYEPKPEAILKVLVPMSLNFKMWKILLESATSEFGSRMTAMETATDNAQEMIKELTLFYNKARQAAITKELNEIVSGAEALKG